MNRRAMAMILLISVIILILDVYAFKSLYYHTKELTSLYRSIVFAIYWFIPVTIITTAAVLGYKSQSLAHDEMDYSVFFALFGAIILFYVPKAFFNAFQIVEDVLNGIHYLVDKFIFHNHLERFTFLTKAGFYTSIILFVYIGQGIVFGKYNYKTTFTSLRHQQLPDSFNGFKIVHISDIHIGSLKNKEKVRRAITAINKQKPDLILFTGDLVNNLAREMDGWENIFAKLEATYGKYSVLGNHDYGDYVDWPSEEVKNKNLKSVIEKHEAIGFQLLLNKSIPVVKGNDTIYIMGVENWGLPPFHQYGDLKQASADVPDGSFKILLSHDPSHWDAEVIPQTNINLTLSGHTHGMQAGISLPFFKWSPVKYKYPRWSGLYKENNQFLYVNQGFGFIGFPGRIGMPPEITVIELTTGS